MNSHIDYPVRVNRYLYLTGMCSRREADKLIEAGEVKINGQKAVLGQQVQATDDVKVSGKVKKKKENRIYVLLHKPIGVVSHNPQNGEKSAEEFLNKYKTPLHPLGRLDKASSGLMLFSNDGTIVDKLLNPKFYHEKTYTVSVDKRIDKHFLQKMEKGVNIEGYMTKPAKIRKLGPNEFELTLTEGKKHQIRRMAAALGYQVQNLKRTSIMNLRLGNLKEGATKKVEGVDLLNFKKGLGVVS